VVAVVSLIGLTPQRDDGVDDGVGDDDDGSGGGAVCW
jgi:hypothetical protein